MGNPVRMYIRHTLQNKAFLDTEKDSLQFEIQPEGPYWNLLVRPVGDQLAEEIKRNRNEMNIFAVEPPENNITMKWWYYAKDEPLVVYSPERRELRITVDSRTSYPSG
jgi:hypothetical protein